MNLLNFKTCVFFLFWNFHDKMKPMVVIPNFLITIKRIRKIKYFSKYYKGDTDLDVFSLQTHTCYIFWNIQYTRRQLLLLTCSSSGFV